MVIKEGVYSYLATLGGNITTSSWNYQVIHSLLLVLNIFLTSQNFSNFFLEIGIIQVRINQSNVVNDTTGRYLHMLYIFHFHKYWIQKKKKKSSEAEKGEWLILCHKWENLHLKKSSDLAYR